MEKLIPVEAAPEQSITYYLIDHENWEIVNRMTVNTSRYPYPAKYVKEQWAYHLSTGYKLAVSVGE